MWSKIVSQFTNFLSIFQKEDKPLTYINNAKNKRARFPDNQIDGWKPSEAIIEKKKEKKAQNLGSSYYIVEGRQQQYLFNDEEDEQFLTYVNQNQYFVNKLEQSMMTKMNFIRNMREKMPNLKNKIDSYIKRQQKNQILDIRLSKTLYYEKIYFKRQRMYSSQIIDFPQITLQVYFQISNFWKSPQNSLTIMPLKTTDPLKKITLKSFQTLAPKQWLNDEVVNEYISLMNIELRRQSNWTIIHSLFMPMLSKPIARVEKAIRKMGYKDGNKLVFSINFRYHWFFVVAGQNSLIIYDSLQKTSIESYLRMEPVKKIIQFCQKFYLTQLKIKKICRNFPQQNNGYDCGIMMLYGIKDCVRDRYQWSFLCQDAFFKRYQTAMQILNQQISGFQ